MIRDISTKQFLIIFSIFLLFILVIRHPDFYAKYFPQSRQKMFNQFQSKLLNNQFDPEDYWQFRERFSPGSFTRDEENTSFFANFRITSIKDDLTPLLYYKSDYFNSLDALVSGVPGDVIKKEKNELVGEVIFEDSSKILIKENSSDYIFVFVLSTDEMQRVNGMFDYIPSEKEFLKEKSWYNITYLSLK